MKLDSLELLVPSLVLKEDMVKIACFSACVIIMLNVIRFLVTAIVQQVGLENYVIEFAVQEHLDQIVQRLVNVTTEETVNLKLENVFVHRDGMGKIASYLVKMVLMEQPAKATAPARTGQIVTTSVVRARVPRAGEVCTVNAHALTDSTAWTASISVTVPMEQGATLQQVHADAHLVGKVLDAHKHVPKENMV